MFRRPALFVALTVAATLTLAGGSYGAPRTPELNIDAPGQCEAGIELDGPPRFFCDLISFTVPGGWQLVPSNTMLVAMSSRPGAASSFTVTTGTREFASFAAFAAVEIPIAKQLIHQGSTAVFVDQATLPAGNAFTVTVHPPNGVVHEVVGVLYKKTGYLMSTVGTTDADQLALQQLIESADFEHPPGVSTHLLVSMDWTATLPAAGGAGPVSVTAANVEIGNRRWSTHLTLSNLGDRPVRVSGLSLLRYDPRYYANARGYTSTSPARQLELGPGKSWTGTAGGADDIAFPDQLFRVAVSFASTSLGPAPSPSAAYGPVLAAPAAH